MYVTEATQYCVTAGYTLIFKSVQSRKLGQSPICCTGGARHHAPRAHNVRSIPYPYMKVITTYNYVAGLQSLQWLLICPWASQQDPERTGLIARLTTQRVLEQSY